MHYFKTFKTENDFGEGFALFNGHYIPTQRSPNCFDILGELEMTSGYFVKKANELFDKYSIHVPSNYPKPSTGEQGFFGNFGDHFAICIGCCILIEDNFGFDTSRIIRNELIGNSKKGIILRSAILHASTMAAIVLHYLNKGANIVIPKQQANQHNPDLVIDGLDCDVKVIQEFDWETSASKGEVRSLSNDICYDVGNFIQNRTHKGIKQSDVIFADLSLKSFGWVNGTGWITENNPGLPTLQKYRIVYLAKEIIYFYSFFIDFDPQLWDLIKSTETRHSFAKFGKAVESAT